MWFDSILIYAIAAWKPVHLMGLYKGRGGGGGGERMGLGEVLHLKRVMII